MAKGSPHPFDPLSPAEISLAAKIIRDAFPDDSPYFRVITLSEPHKDEMVLYLEDQTSGGSSRPARMATVQLYLNGRSSNNFYELKVDLRTGAVVAQEQLLGRHSHVNSDDMQKGEVACLQDPRVLEALEVMRLPDDAVVCVEPWTYATDGMNDMSKKFTMCYFYMRLVSHADANLYAYPLDICAEMSGDFKILRVFPLPSDGNDTASKEFKPFDRTRIHSTSEYHPDLVTQPQSIPKPLVISQPEGPSFTTNGNLIAWERWTFRVGFNYREGMTLHDVRYDDRSLFYRLSLSEMFVPYGDPRSPFTRKAAFDLGNDGAGVNANNLTLGCDCLGHIKYFDGWHNTSSGDPMKLPKVICCHEIDDGILFKHMNHRTQHPVVARSRVLVLQTIITVSNYEYIFAFHFDQAAGIHYEVRATGILSTAPIEVGIPGPGYGLVVAPGVLAPYHQHLFCLRIDAAIDGNKNTLMVEESHAMPLDDTNPYGVGYTTRTTPTNYETGFDLDHTTNRSFKIVNENILNPTTGTPVGYKLVPYYSSLLLAHPESYHAKRSEFGAHAVWVTQYADNELFASGKHTMQSLGGEGIASWIAKRQSSAETDVRNKDIVIWHTFGSTHNPRIEDWPVMPCEKMVVGLKPVNFFDKGNPVVHLGKVAKRHGMGELNGSDLVGHDESAGNGEGNLVTNGV